MARQAPNVVSVSEPYVHAKDCTKCGPAGHVEQEFCIVDQWARSLLVAVCEANGVKPFARKHKGGASAVVVMSPDLATQKRIEGKFFELLPVMFDAFGQTLNALYEKHLPTLKLPNKSLNPSALFRCAAKSPRRRGYLVSTHGMLVLGQGCLVLLCGTVFLSKRGVLWRCWGLLLCFVGLVSYRGVVLWTRALVLWSFGGARTKGRETSMAKKVVAKKEAVSSKQPSLEERMAAVPVASLVTIPSHGEAFAEHLGALAKVAKEDSEHLQKVPLEDGALHAWELDLFPLAAARAKGLAVAIAADKLAKDAGLSESDQTLLLAVREDQALLLSAFQRLRFKGQTAQLKVLRAIAVGAPNDVVDALDDSTKLIALAKHEDHRAWVASLPLGESAAVERLEKAQARLGELAALEGDKRAGSKRRDDARRVWTLLLELDRRVRSAAAYYFHNKPRRESYKAFAPPHKRKKAKKEAL